MPMRLIVRTGALVVTSGIAVTAVLVGPYGGIPTWGTGLVLSIVLLAVAAGAVLDIAEWKQVSTLTSPAPAPTSAMSPGARTRALAAAREGQAAWATVTPLWPLRTCFTLRYKTSGEVLAKAFPTAGDQAGEAPIQETPIRETPIQETPIRETLSREALDGWLERYSGFGEWPIKRPVEMTVEFNFREPAGGGTRGLVRFERLFSDGPVEVKSVSRIDDRLVQDNDVSGWVMSNRTAASWTVADLEHAAIRVKAVYLSFDDDDFREPPRFETLHLCFGDPARCVLTFTPSQLAVPAIREDPAPLMRGPFFKTLLLEYELSLSAIALAEQLAPVRV